MKKTFFILAVLLGLGLVVNEASALGWRRAARARAAAATTTTTYRTYTYYGGNNYGSTVIDYDDDYYYPRDGATRYKDGLHWTFNADRGLWISEWYPVR